MSRRFVVEADGGSRGNPGPAAYGALVRDPDTGDILLERGERIGVASNNVAEYRGLIAALELVRGLDPEADVEVRMDSKLVVEQMSGRWQVKHPDMKALAKQAMAIMPRAQVSYSWIPRERNKAADRLVNAALDGTAVDSLPVLDAEEDPGRSESAQLASTRANHLVGWSPDLGAPLATLLVRHGETAMTREKLFSGTGGADPSLTEGGIAQARAVGRLLAAQEPEVAAVVTSPLRRTQETAAIVAEELSAAGLSAEMVVEDDFRETAFGDWDGYSYAEVAKRWPRELEKWLTSTAAAPPFGEAFDAVQRRVEEARDRLALEYGGRTLVIVTHVTPIKALVRRALEAPATSLFRMQLSPGSLTTLHWWADGAASLRAFNALPGHLDGPKR